MQTLNATDAGGLMAAWRASGGAIGGPAGGQRETAGDDGLAAMAYSNRPGCYVDDGLEATAYSNARSPVCADDGLAAMLQQPPGGYVDDGSAAGPAAACSRPRRPVSTSDSRPLGGSKSSGTSRGQTVLEGSFRRSPACALVPRHRIGGAPGRRDGV